MKIRKTGWAVWDKVEKKFEVKRGMIIYSDKTTAWLAAQKERKGSEYKVIKVLLSLS